MQEVLIHMGELTLLLMLVIPSCYSLNTLESNPAALNGTLTACSGNRIEMTCSHNLVNTINTIWRFGPPVSCSTTITHGETPETPPCGSSMIDFQNVTAATTVLTSTAVVAANVTMSGSVVECRGGNIANSIDVGNISLCVIGQLPPPADLQCMNTTKGLMITWNDVTDTSCAESPVKYSVTVVRQSDGMVIDSLTDLDGNETETNKIEPNVDYRISLSTRTTIASCVGEPAIVMCRKSAPDNNVSAGSSLKSTLTFIILLVVLPVVIVQIKLL